MEKRKNVLHIIPVLDYSGVSSVVLGQLEIARQNGYNFDFLHHGKEEKFHEELELSGSKIYKIDTIGRGGIIKYFYEINKIIKMNKYDIVHIHTNYQAGLIAWFLKIIKVQKRIIHVHGDYIGSKKIEYVLPILKKLINKFSTDRIAVSERSGDYYFGKNNYKLVLNGINLEKFQNINLAKMLEIEKELLFQNKKLNIIQIGRFSSEKNHVFTIEILKRLKENNLEFCCYFIGDGDKKKLAKKLIKESRLNSNVVFTGNRKDINYLIKLSDVILLPSISEGFPMVALEAQAIGRNIIVSDNITQKIDLGLQLVQFLSLNNINEWSEKLVELSNKKNNSTEVESNIIKRAFQKNKVDLKSNFEIILKIYEKDVL